MSSKWPYHANGEVVLDYGGDFVAAACTERTARLLAAAPMLYLHFKAVETVLDELRRDGKLEADQDNRIFGCRGEVEKALAGWEPA